MKLWKWWNFDMCVLLMLKSNAIWGSNINAVMERQLIAAQKFLSGLTAIPTTWIWCDSGSSSYPLALDARVLPRGRSQPTDFGYRGHGASEDVSSGTGFAESLMHHLRMVVLAWGFIWPWPRLDRAWPHLVSGIMDWFCLDRAVACPRTESLRFMP